MADFFNKLKKSIDKGTAIVGAKSTTLIETQKIRQDISSIEKMKKDTLLTLGQKVYDLKTQGQLDGELLEPLVTKITEANAKIKDLEAKINLLQEEEKAKMEDINAKANAEDVEASETTVDVEATEVSEPVEENEETMVADSDSDETITGEYKG
jgi:outer membrane murein-binding lipoprotein Lpp